MNQDLDNLHKTESEASGSWEAQEKVSSAETVDKLVFDELKSKFDEIEDKYKRLWADQQNMLNRFNRERQDLLKYAASGAISSILPALDNFDFAKRSINANTSHEELVKSLDMLQEQLLLSLKSVGLEEVATNVVYNPELHEAVSFVLDANQPEGTIVEVIKKGFRIQDRVLRPATVVVTKQS